MLTCETILEELGKHSGRFRESYGVRRIGLFGSFARSEAAPQSDIDFIVEFDTPTFDHYMDLKFFLEELLKTPVDLVVADTVKPRLRPHISVEAVYV